MRLPSCHGSPTKKVASEYTSRPSRRVRSQNASQSWAGVACAVTEYSTRDSMAIFGSLTREMPEGIASPSDSATVRGLQNQFKKKHSRGQVRSESPFQFEQAPFYIEPSAKATQTSVGGDHSMTGHDDCDRVVVVGHTHRPER